MPKTARKVIVGAGLLAIVIVLASGAALAWRLRQGPLPLPFLDPYVRQAFQQAGTDLLLEFDGSELAWDASRPIPEIRILGARLLRRDRTPVGVFPELALGPSKRALLRGRLAVGWIGLPGVRLALTRQPGGQLTLGTAKQSSDAIGELSPTLGALFSAPADADSPVSYLRRIRIRDAEIVLEDRLTETSWKATKTQLDIRRRSAGITAKFQSELAVRGASGSLRLPIAATAAAVLDAGGGLAAIHFEASGDRGRFETSGEGARSLTLGPLEVAGQFAGESKTLEIQRLRLRGGPATLDAKMKVAFGGGSPGFQASGELRGLPASDVELVWPPSVAAAAREWVRENVRDGTVASARFALRLPAPASASHGAAGDALRVDFTYGGLTVDYFRPLRPVGAVGGSGTLTEHGLDVTVLSGELGALRVEAARMHMDFTGKPGSAAIAVDVNGPSEDLLALLDTPPLGYPSRLGIPTRGVGAASRTHAEFRFPLIDHLSSDQLEIAANTVIEGNGVDAALTTGVAAGAVQRLTVERLRFGRNDLTGTATLQPDGRYRISASGAAIDLEPLRERMTAGATPSPRIGRAYDLEFQFARATSVRNLEISNLHGRARSEGDALQSLEATGLVAGVGVSRATLTRVPEGRRIEVASDHAGEVLRALGVFEDARGGRLTLIVTFRDQDGDAVPGVLRLRDFRVTKAPLLARVLTLGSLDGISDMLTGGEGISFTRARFPFTWAHETITVADGRAVGSIGLTVDGVIDRPKSHINIAGDIIPAYTLSSALGKIPLIGQLLVGAKGGGIFGIKYQLVGSLEHPEVISNPLSGLAPTTLREIFVDPFVQAVESAF